MFLEEKYEACFSFTIQISCEMMDITASIKFANLSDIIYSEF